MKRDDFCDFYSKLLLEIEKSDDSAPLFSMHNYTKPNQDQSPISDGAQVAPKEVEEPPPTQDQADDQPFKEAVPLEDELANLLDDID